MTLRYVCMGAVAAAFVSTSVWAQMPPPAAGDAEFAMKASVGNTFEIQEAQLAVDKATDPQLKMFAQHMIADHTKALNDLKTAAQADNLKAEMMLDAPHQMMVDNLKTKSGTEFDKIYQADQVASHAETVALLSDYQTNGKNSRLMSWTKTSLPIVKGHKAAIDAMP